MAINQTSVKILTDSLKKAKDDKDVFMKQIASVNLQIDAFQLSKREIQRQIDECTVVINDLKIDLGITT